MVHATLKSMNRVASRGFTLIELLAAIAIIGILSAIVLASLNSARAKSRDAGRIADMQAVITALEYAKSDGPLPDSGSSVLFIAGDTTHATIKARLDQYMQTYPAEPVETNSTYFYRYCNGPDKTGSHSCLSDDNPYTFSIRFRTETQPLGGPTAYHCATSKGIEPVPEAESGNPTLCVQR